MEFEFMQNLHIKEEVIIQWVVGFMVVGYFWELYLALRQSKIYKTNRLVPNELIGIMRQRTFDKARHYGSHKNTFHMISDTFSLIGNLAFLGYDGLFHIWKYSGHVAEKYGHADDEIIQSIVCIAILNVLNTVCHLPFSIYYTFVLEEKHGFNKQTPLFFFFDKIKMHVLQQVIIIPLICGIIHIVKIGGRYFFIYLWLFVTGMTLFLYTIYPDFIAPLFDKYKLLPKGELRTEIETLARALKFPLYRLYVVEGSRRSAHSNAYFYGLFSKRIVLFDTLIKPDDSSEKKSKKEDRLSKDEDKQVKGCNIPEVLAVLGHELGHWKLNHVLKNIIIVQANLFLVFFVFGVLFRFKPLYNAFGFYESSPVLIGLIIVLHFVCLPYFELLNFGVGILSRRFEFEADEYVRRLGRKNSLKRALVKINSDNLGFPIYDPLYSMWHHSHPPLLERLQALS